MKILTGKTGTPHVTGQQFRQLVEGTVGQESYILTSGENLEPELSSNNLLKIRSGIMSHHGNLSTVEIGTYDEVTIQNGTQGMKRIDLVVNRYTKNDETGIEENEWVVIMGTPDADSPVAPAYTEGNLQEGDLVDDCPVFEVHLDGINVTEVKKLLSVSPDIPTLNAYLSQLSSKTKVETFELVPSSNVNTLAQKCYYEPLTGRVHIEAAHYTEEGIKSSMDLAIVPAKYAPKATAPFPLSMSDTGGLGYIYTDGKIRQNASSVQAFAYYSTDYFI